MSFDTSFDRPALLAEAQRQFTICNACRYCEGYCDVFPEMFARRAFAEADLSELASLCHNCRGCHYACQYAPPHEFAVSLPGLLASARTESWERHAWPAPLARAFQRHGLALAAALALGVAALFGALSALGGAGEGFYAHLSHAAMVAIFTPAFLFPLLCLAMTARSYWREIGGAPLRLRHIAEALASAARLKNLSGGQGQGCNFEKGDRYSNARRWAHQAVAWGFLACFAATAAGTILHYGFNAPAPYPLLSLPKLLGLPGGIAMTAGAAALVWLRARAEAGLSDARTAAGEVAFTFLTGLTALSGLALYAASGSALQAPLLALHLGTVLAFFITAPWSKMVHPVFRLAALIRHAQRQER